MSRETTVEDLEEFWERLQGPLGRALRATGLIMAARLEAQGRTVADLDDDEMIAMMHSAFREAAPAHYVHKQHEEVAVEIDRMFADIVMQMASTNPASEVVN